MSSSPPRKRKDSGMSRLTADELEVQIARLNAELEERKARGLAAPREPGRATLGPAKSSKSTKAPVKLEIDGEMKPEVDKETKKLYDQATSAHVRGIWKSLMKARDTYDVGEPLFDNDKKPVYWQDNILRPQYELSFSVNFAVWGQEFYKVVTDETHFREVLRTGVFVTMTRAWKKANNGTLEQWSNKKVSGRQRSSKKTKAKGRKRTLEGSGLDPEEFGFLVEADYQSSEYSDAEDPNHFAVNDPKYRAEIAKSLVSVLDRKANSGKNGKDSAAGTKRKLSYVAINCDVPPRKKGTIDCLGGPLARSGPKITRRWNLTSSPHRPREIGDA
ncbi:hypothetical protein FRC06_002329 [Ceratobasidium sp. 370]|nr:hypothetical protein FRC06_002329 [Ceratobasidium sp. 370]